MANEFEEAARAKKVAALVEHFDRWVNDAGHDPHRDAQLVADTLSRMNPTVWDANASAAGLKNGPSATTRGAVVAVYLGRAESASNPTESGTQAVAVEVAS